MLRYVEAHHQYESIFTIAKSGSSPCTSPRRCVPNKVSTLSTQVPSEESAKVPSSREKEARAYLTRCQPTPPTPLSPTGCSLAIDEGGIITCRAPSSRRPGMSCDIIARGTKHMSTALSLNNVVAESLLAISRIRRQGLA